MQSYTWEIQRQHFGGIWSNQAIVGKPEDPRGFAYSSLAAEEFAQTVLRDHPVDGPHQLVIWDQCGVGHRPVLVLTNH